MKNRIVLLCLLLLAVSRLNSFAGRYLYGEARTSLAGEWMFKADYNDVGEKSKWFATDFDDSQWDRMSVPGSWELTNEYSTYIGKGWYRTGFETPKIKSGQKVFLEFEAVSMSYKVYVNGSPVGAEEVGNYIERFDVTRFLKPEGRNVVAVQVDNSLSWGAYCNWGGIRRPVDICVLDPVHVLRQEITAVPDMENGTSTVRVKAVVENLSDDADVVTLQSVISKNEKDVTSSTKNDIRVGAHATAEVFFDYKLDSQQTELWDIDHPHLYTSVLSLSQNSRALNKYSDRFGIRKLEFDGYQFKLNGKSLRLAGFNWVADDRTSGNTLPAWRYKEDIDRMKMLGANMARLSHRTLPEEVLDYLDEVGFLTVSEFNNWSDYMNPKSEEPRIFARKMIHQQFNHPCVVGWSVGNEMGDRNSHPQVDDYVASIIKYIKKDLDSTRFVLYVSNTANSQKDDAAKYCDFIMINKYGGYVTGIDALKKLFPGKPVFVSEYGSHHVNLLYDTPNKSKWSSMMIDGVCDREHVFGISLWTYDDYRSLYQSPSLSTSTPLHQNRQWGVVDVYRNKKRSYNQMRKFFSPVKDFTLTSLSKGKNPKSLITVEPRAVFDIPSFELDDYSIVWEVRNKDNKTVQGGIIPLSRICPGDGKMTFPISWRYSADAAYVKASLVNPNNYTVAESRVSVAPPAVPDFQILKGSHVCRVVYQKNDFADEYYVKYTVRGVTKKSALTIDHYIDLSEFEIGDTSKVQLVAVNDAGEQASPVKVFVSTGGCEELPPIIWQTQACNHGFYVGQGFSYSDLYYVVRYTQTPNDDKSWCYSQNRNLGMCKVSGLENGKKYYFQIAKTAQGAGKGGLSIWSEMKEVTPSATDVAEGSPVLHGVVTNGNDIAFVCTPAKDGSLYKIQYRQSGKPKECIVSRGDFDYIVVKNAGKGKITDARLTRIK